MGTKTIEEIEQRTVTREATVCDCCGLMSVDEHGNEVDIGFNTVARNYGVLNENLLLQSDEWDSDDIIEKRRIDALDAFGHVRSTVTVAVVGEQYDFCDICDSVLFGGDA